jgi:hypothetical protein
MTREAFEAQVEKTLATIAVLPEERRAPLLALVDEARRRHAEIAADVGRAREALDDWRIIAKYRVFDAEATARESAQKL